jgi:hypothetical protein
MHCMQIIKTKQLFANIRTEPRGQRDAKLQRDFQHDDEHLKTNDVSTYQCEFKNNGFHIKF